MYHQFCVIRSTTETPKKNDKYYYNDKDKDTDIVTWQV